MKNIFEKNTEGDVNWALTLIGTFNLDANTYWEKLYNNVNKKKYEALELNWWYKRNFKYHSTNK